MGTVLRVLARQVELYLDSCFDLRVIAQLLACEPAFSSATLRAPPGASSGGLFPAAYRLFVVVAQQAWLYRRYRVRNRGWSKTCPAAMPGRVAPDRHLFPHRRSNLLASRSLDRQKELVQLRD